jgi:hypothetical protein
MRKEMAVVCTEGESRTALMPVGHLTFRVILALEARMTTESFRA